MIKDSGGRTEFETGAVRDIQTDKGRCDLMPLDVAGHLLDSFELKQIDLFRRTGHIGHLYEGLIAFAENQYKGSLDTMLLELSMHFKHGAEKYGEHNWQKGIPLHCYIDSAVRHYLKWRRGDKDEPHDRAFVWNITCGIWTYENMPELDDFTKTEK